MLQCKINKIIEDMVTEEINNCYMYYELNPGSDKTRLWMKNDRVEALLDVKQKINYLLKMEAVE